MKTRPTRRRRMTSSPPRRPPPPTLRERVGHAFLIARETRKLSRHRVAQMANMDANTIKAIEITADSVGWAYLDTYARALGTNLDEILRSVLWPLDEPIAPEVALIIEAYQRGLYAERRVLLAVAENVMLRLGQSVAGLPPADVPSADRPPAAPGSRRRGRKRADRD